MIAAAEAASEQNFELKAVCPFCKADPLTGIKITIELQECLLCCTEQVCPRNTIFSPYWISAHTIG